MGDEIQLEDAISAVGSDLTLTGGVGDEGTLVPKEASHESIPVIHSYQIKPSLQDKFKANPVKEIIRTVVGQKLTGKSYDSDSAKRWSTGIANEINIKVKELRMKRYKHVVEVVIGELKGAGFKSGVRCLWDSETDGYTSDTFMNETIFCLVIVFAVYLY